MQQVRGETPAPTHKTTDNVSLRSHSPIPARHHLYFLWHTYQNFIKNFLYFKKPHKLNEH